VEVPTSDSARMKGAMNKGLSFKKIPSPLWERVRVRV
jgi:hypothetical protein